MNALEILAWVVGLGFLALCWRTAVWIDEAPFIDETHPDALGSLDIKEREHRA